MHFRRIAIPALLLLAFATVVAFPGTADARKKLLHDIPLEWEPTDELGDYSPVNLTGIYDLTIELGEFTDDREDPALIAENLEDEDEGEILPVTTSDDVAAWVRDRTGYLMEQFGLEIEESGGDVVITGEVKRFFVEETNLYNSDIGLQLSIVKDGETVYRGVFGGSATRFGRSYKAQNYYEVLSDALIEAVHDALTNDAFMDALREVS